MQNCTRLSSSLVWVKSYVESQPLHTPPHALLLLVAVYGCAILYRSTPVPLHACVHPCAPLPHPRTASGHLQVFSVMFLCTKCTRLNTCLHLVWVSALVRTPPAHSTPLPISLPRPLQVDVRPCCHPASLPDRRWMCTHSVWCVLKC